MFSGVVTKTSASSDKNVPLKILVGSIKRREKLFRSLQNWIIGVNYFQVERQVELIEEIFVENPHFYKQKGPKTFTLYKQ